MLQLLAALSDKPLRFLDIKIINTPDFLDMLFRFGLDMALCVLIIHFISRNRNKSFTFTYYTLNALVFLLCYLLGNVKLELGFALGLFAIFGIIRYRTSLISIKDMTYLFVIIGIAVINALANKKVSWAELLFANFAIAGVMYLRERLIRPSLKEKDIRYDNVSLIHSAKKQELMDDISNRLGIRVVDVSIGEVDYLKDSASVSIFYYDK